jgi:hypothetical protein
VWVCTSVVSCLRYWVQVVVESWFLIVRQVYGSSGLRWFVSSLLVYSLACWTLAYISDIDVQRPAVESLIVGWTFIMLRYCSSTQEPIWPIHYMLFESSISVLIMPMAILYFPSFSSNAISSDDSSNST